MRTATVALGMLIILSTLVTPSSAIRRSRVDNPFFARTAVSGYIGTGVAVGEFSSEKIGDGNHESGAFDWAAEIEYFFSPGWSLGFNISHSTYDDKTLGDSLQTNLAVYGGYIRYVIDTGGPVYPFFRAGVGSMEVEFEDPIARIEADRAGSLHVGGGAAWMIGKYVSVNAQALYTNGFTDETEVGEIYEDEDGNLFVEVVGFDVQYWAFSGGVTVYFP